MIQTMCSADFMKGLNFPAEAIEELLSMLPDRYATEFRALFDEMAKRETNEAKLLKLMKEQGLI